MSDEIDTVAHVLDAKQALSIDLGTAENLAAYVDTLGNSLLIDARVLKAMNQLGNKKVATRKQYHSSNGSIVNADLKGAANILKKVASNLGIDLGLLGRGVLTAVARVRQWIFPKSSLVAQSPCL